MIFLSFHLNVRMIHGYFDLVSSPSNLNSVVGNEELHFENMSSGQRSTILKFR